MTLRSKNGERLDIRRMAKIEFSVFVLKKIKFHLHTGIF